MVKKVILNILFITVLLITPILVSAHGADYTRPVHQYLTNESKFVWRLIPYEMKDHLKNSITELLYLPHEIGGWNVDARKECYDKGNDIITGSAEEDYCLQTGGPATQMRNHYWDADYPLFNSSYDKGLYGSEGSFVHSRELWNKALELYLKGEKDKAYYYFGRVVHLLEDASVPAHMHLDPHWPDKDEYEYFIADVNNSFTDTQGKGNFNHWKGSNYQNQYYKYENLTDLTESEWLEINKRLDEAGYPSELFKLFWYTAQKTQYYASDDKYGNTTFRKSSGAATYNFSGTYPNLWQGENVNFVMNKDDIESDASQCNSVGVCPNLANISEALMPHAMKATAGLYRLFSDAMDSLEWETFHNNNRRTGFTLLKGDFDANTNKDELTFEGNPNTDFWDSPIIADIDRDGKGEIIIGTHNRYSTLGVGRVFALDGRGYEKWSYNAKSRVAHAPAVGDLDRDNIKEVVFGTLEGHRVYILDAKTGSYKDSYAVPPDPAFGLRGYVFGIAIADIDNNGENEIVFADFYPYLNYQAQIHAINKNGDEVWSPVLIGSTSVSTGTQGAPAIADIDNDSKLELIVGSYFGVFAFEGESGTLKWQRNICAILGTPAVADVDNDGNYEIIVNTENINAEYYPFTCYNRTYVLDSSDGSDKSGWPETHNYMPETSPAIANLDDDDYLEIVVGTTEIPDFYEDPYSGPTKGRIRILDGYTSTEQCSYTDSGNLDAVEGSPDILDIDNDNELEIIFGAKDGYFYVIDEDCNHEWKKDLGDRMWSAPAIGDIDGDLQTAEIAVKHFSGTGGSSLSTTMMFGDKILKTYGGKYYEILEGTPEEEKFLESSIKPSAVISSTITVIDGINEQPQLVYIDNIYAIEGDFINITINASDWNNDTLTYYFSSPLNNSNNQQEGTWQTNDSGVGTYGVIVEVSDGNLSDSQLFTLTVFENGTELVSNFSDGAIEKNLTYTTAENQTIYVEVPKNASILRAAVDITGHSIEGQSYSYQEPDPVVIDATVLNISANLTVDKDWDTYYSAGSETGIIVEIRNLDVPSSPNHIIFHLKLRVYMGGSGRFGIYNYNTQTYEIVTSSLSAFNETNRDIYVDVYGGESPLWITNKTHFSMQVSNLSEYISNNKTRWYYRYLGEWASQMIYESEVKFEEDITYPQVLTLDVGGNGTVDYETKDELHNNIVRLNRLNNSKKNETFDLPVNTSVTRYISVPKNALLTRAVINVGSKIVSTLSASTTAMNLYREPVVSNNNPYDINKDINLGSFKFATTIKIEGNSVDIKLELLEKGEGEITIRDVFAKTIEFLDGEMWTLGHKPLNYKFKHIGDSVQIHIDLNKNMGDDFRYLLYNYYYLSNGKTENGEYLQYVNATIK